MGEKRRGKTTESAMRRYGIWVLGIAVVIAVVAIGVIAWPRTGTVAPSTYTGTLDPLEIPRISPEEVKARLEAGHNLVIVDARSKGSYERTHIAGAVSIPLEEITERYDELRGYDEIVTYCT